MFMEIRSVMDKLLVVCCSAQQREKLDHILRNYYELEYADTTEAASAILSSGSYLYRMVLLALDEMTAEILQFLEKACMDPYMQDIPLLVLSQQLPDRTLEEALKRGAYEYLNLDGSPWLLINRIKNIDQVFRRSSPAMQAMNTFLFNKCIGPALLLETDLQTIRPILINDDFFTATGVERSVFDAHSADLSQTILPSEKDGLYQAIKAARIDGQGQCVTSNPRTRKRFRVTYKRIGEDTLPIRLLATLEDITENLHYLEITDALLRLPGQIIFDYDAAADQALVYIGAQGNGTSRKTVTHCLDLEKHTWISPDSYQTFTDAFVKARSRRVEGSIEVLASLIHKNYSWHRIFYRSITDSSGHVTRIVGRIDDLERMEWNSAKSEESGLCDAETHLLTYRATIAFVDQIISSRKEGILMLLDVNGLRRLCSGMPTSVHQMYVRELIAQLKSLFIQTDIVGRFGEEGLLIFMPETTSHHLAEKKAAALIEMIGSFFPDGECTCNVGISIIHSGHPRAASVVNDANIALWQAKTEGRNNFIIFRNETE